MKELWYVHKTKVLVVVVFFVLFCFLIWSKLYDSVETQAEKQVSFLVEPPLEFDINDENMDETEKEMTGEKPVDIELLIDIKGAVLHPGVYRMKSGERIIDAVEQAGGFLEDADTRKVNLAALLTDEMVILVPREGEDLEEAVILQSENNGNDPTAHKEGKVNINTASLEELTTLTGVGPAKAKAIIDYRTEHGMFKQVEDIVNVTGIGEKSFEKIRDEITVAN
ncbi:helix-hairpin-helix domain-containing protein [Bacillus sp. LL01]|uniref:helix-hairpin-helix domain-containing protein n=1 Tax=Bacillus sp. LL01 TaxID=1665556 RepID=UPI00069CE806|nr:helix-hairpin-helix domain-containing protein [Bacillus sp. LL01]